MAHRLCRLLPLSLRDQPHRRASRRVAGTVFFLLLASAMVVTGVYLARRFAGVRGVSSQVATMYWWAWTLGFVTYAVNMAGAARAGEAIRLLWSSGSGLAALAEGDRISFPRLQKLLGMTAGNLSVHLRKLEDAGYVGVSKTHEGRTPAPYVWLTRIGRRALEDYTASLRELLTPPPTGREAESRTLARPEIGGSRSVRIEVTTTRLWQGISRPLARV
jgi:DNA-binding MarR family transcriptional regulator